MIILPKILFCSLLDHPVLQSCVLCESDGRWKRGNFRGAIPRAGEQSSSQQRGPHSYLQHAPLLSFMCV